MRSTACRDHPRQRVGHLRPHQRPQSDAQHIRIG
jgi:hypothetical protein